MRFGNKKTGSFDPDRDRRRRMSERLDVFGENQKSSRKNIPRARAATHRSYRRTVNVELLQGADADPVVRRRRFKKWPGKRRDDQLRYQAERRSRP